MKAYNWTMFKKIILRSKTKLPSAIKTCNWILHKNLNNKPTEQILRCKYSPHLNNLYKIRGIPKWYRHRSMHLRIKTLEIHSFFQSNFLKISKQIWKKRSRYLRVYHNLKKNRFTRIIIQEIQEIMGLLTIQV